METKYSTYITSDIGINVEWTEEGEIETVRTYWRSDGSSISEWGSDIYAAVNSAMVNRTPFEVLERFKEITEVVVKEVDAYILWHEKKDAPRDDSEDSYRTPRMGGGSLYANKWAS